MPGGTGKHTYFNVNNSPKKLLLEKLFPGNEVIKPPFIGLDREGARLEAVKVANAKLRSEETNGVVDTGDPAIGRVDLSYRGGGDSVITPPNTLEGAGEVAWSKPGDPATPYFPDIRSPGPGKTEGVDKVGDPGITTKDIKPNFDPDNASENTLSPAKASPDLYASNHLG
jgi:hypothetical protein